MCRTAMGIQKPGSPGECTQLELTLSLIAHGPLILESITLKRQCGTRSKGDAWWRALSGVSI